MSLARVANALRGIGSGLTIQAPKVQEAKAPEPTPAVDPFSDPRWSMLRDVDPDKWDLEVMYHQAGGTRVSEKPIVAIVVPSYRESERIAQVCRISRNKVREHAAQAGVETIVAPLSGDSLVCRMRQRAVHLFLMTSATHMLFWDADIECITPDVLARMVSSGHDVVAGACPFKSTGGKTVHNLWPADEGQPPKVVNGFVEVQDAGTGFMMIRRRALIALQQAHPELLHWSMSQDADRGAPLWALFDTGIVDGVYQSEDYYFCRLWQSHGGRVWVDAHAKFRHWGEHGFEGSFAEQYGL